MAQALLRDLALLSTQPKAARRVYRPHLYSPLAAAAALAQMQPAWPSILSAVIATMDTPSWEAVHAPPPAPRPHPTSPHR